MYICIYILYTRTIPTDTHEGGGRILGNWFCRLLRHRCHRRRHPSKAHTKKNITIIKKDPLKKFYFLHLRQHNIAITLATLEKDFRRFRYL